VQSILDSLIQLGLTPLEAVIITKTYNYKRIKTESLSKEMNMNPLGLSKVLENLFEKDFLKKDNNFYTPLTTLELTNKINNKLKQLKHLKKDFSRFELLLNETTKYYDNSGKLNKKLIKIRDNITGKGGRLKNGNTLVEQPTKELFEKTHNQIICVPKNFNNWILKTPYPTITTFGGICVLRTYENRTLSLKSKLIDTKTGKHITPNNLKTFIKWIETNISLDQITSAILPNQTNNYILYTEETLWSKKLISYFEKINNTKLNSQQKQLIFKACQNTEKKKFKLVKKYLQHISDKNIKIEHITDTSIMNILIKARNTLFKKTNITIDNITNEVISNLSKPINNRKQIYNHLEQYTLVWTLFTGIFWDLMYKNRLIKTKNILITAPWSLTTPNKPDGKSFFNDVVFSSNNQYLETGINKNIALIATQEPSTFNHKTYTTNKPINEVINILNWKDKIEEYKKATVTLNLDENKVYIATSNYLPYRQYGGVPQIT